MKIRGLLLKDWYELWNKSKVLIIMVVVYMLIGLVSPTLGSVALLLCAMLPYNSIAYDEKVKWNRYALSMPVSKKELVLSKYLLGIIGVGIGIILLALLQFVPVGEPANWNMVVLSGAGALFYLAVQLPLLFRFGTENGRIWTLLLTALFAVGIVFLTSFVEETDSVLEAASKGWASWAAFAAAAAAQVVSYLISLKIFRVN